MIENLVDILHFTILNNINNKTFNELKYKIKYDSDQCV